MHNIIYFEIRADDLTRAKNFYETVFGWTFTKRNDLPIEYWGIRTKSMTGGLLKRPALVKDLNSGTNAFICSVMVANFDEAEAKILVVGGRIALPKMTLPKMGYQGYFLDTEGNTFGIFEVNESV